MTLEEKMNELAKMKMEEGKKEGIKEGHLKGVEETSQKIALAMKKEGFSTEQIAKLTKLAAEEIENL